MNSLPEYELNESDRAVLIQTQAAPPSFTAPRQLTGSWDPHTTVLSLTYSAADIQSCRQSLKVLNRVTDEAVTDFRFELDGEVTTLSFDEFKEAMTLHRRKKYLAAVPFHTPEVNRT